MNNEPTIPIRLVYRAAADVAYIAAGTDYTPTVADFLCALRDEIRLEREGLIALD